MVQAKPAGTIFLDLRSLGDLTVFAIDPVHKHGRPLGFVTGEAQILTDFKGRHPVEGRKRLIVINADRIFLIQMQIQLGDLPCAVLRRRFREGRRFIGKRYGFRQQIRIDPVHTVTVLSLQVMAYRHQRTESADLFHHIG